MQHVLWLIPFLPVLGFAVLVVFGHRMGRRTIAVIGAAPAGAAAAVAIATAVSFLVAPPATHAYDQVMWTWFRIGAFAPRIAFHLDPLSLVMTLVVTFVGFLILLYSTRFMRGDEGYRRFFAYMDLFIASMLILVLAGDFLFLLVGWEGVGLSSFLLIGFWYRERANGAAARKAFIVTRVGDTALLVGLLLIFTKLGTLDIQGAMAAAQSQWAQGAAVATAAALLLMGGAIGKSAQLPLQTWLPDAMAGPTPVSALIHAATMVTAGVYLIARTHVLFELSPTARLVVAVIGAATLLYAGVSALAQNDIKRALAYSTISQIGYMFLALGVAAWSAAVFHFLTHAFFKALLFLSAGLVIKAMDEEHDIRKMGGLRRDIPVVFRLFLIGAAALSALPLVTAGFFSKDLIVDLALTSVHGGVWLWLAGVVGALLTSLYSFRLVFLVFFGERRGSAPVATRFPRLVVWPMVALAAGSVVLGWIELPVHWHGWSLFTDFMASALPVPGIRAGGLLDAIAVTLIPAIVSVAGVYLAWVLFGRRRPAVAGSLVTRPGFRWLAGAALAGWGFDRLYHVALVRPFLWLAHHGQRDWIDRLVSGIAGPAAALGGLLRRTQDGRLRYYLAAAALGIVVFVAVGLLR